jgi:hypothetical protein
VKLGKRSGEEVREMSAEEIRSLPEVILVALGFERVLWERV